MNRRAETEQLLSILPFGLSVLRVRDFLRRAEPARWQLECRRKQLHDRGRNHRCADRQSIGATQRDFLCSAERLRGSSAGKSYHLRAAAEMETVERKRTSSSRTRPATSNLLILGRRTSSASRENNVTTFVSPSKPAPGSVTSLATIKSAFLEVSFLRALACNVVRFRGKTDDYAARIVVCVGRSAFTRNIGKNIGRGFKL